MKETGIYLLNNYCESCYFFLNMHFLASVSTVKKLTVWSFLSQVAQLPLSVSDGRWHHICITWTTRDGFWEAYQDGERLGTGENLAPWHPIKPGGVIILGQEQVSAWGWERGRKRADPSRGRHATIIISLHTRWWEDVTTQQHLRAQGLLERNVTCDTDSKHTKSTCDT